MWLTDREGVCFPESGFLGEYSGAEILGGLGFRSGKECCNLWLEGHGHGVDWATLVDRVTSQARKSKYRRAQCAEAESIPADLAEVLIQAGFSGDPLSRELVFDAPDDLQPYLDWKGRVTRIAEGKGSEGLNARLYEIVASQFPVEGQFSEVEVNAILKELHLYGDHAGLRRELIDRGYLGRTKDCRAYWKVANPQIIGRI